MFQNIDICIYVRVTNIVVQIIIIIGYGEIRINKKQITRKVKTLNTISEGETNILVFKEEH